jgi:hypothetical protein
MNEDRHNAMQPATVSTLRSELVMIHNNKSASTTRSQPQARQIVKALNNTSVLKEMAGFGAHGDTLLLICHFFFEPFSRFAHLLPHRISPEGRLGRLILKRNEIAVPGKPSRPGLVWLKGRSWLGRTKHSSDNALHLRYCKSRCPVVGWNSRLGRAVPAFIEDIFLLQAWCKRKKLVSLTKSSPVDTL